jgi:prepilin-type N-terminal cleavage/methylation domain-containing protein
MSRNRDGFTLIEVMISLVIVAVLAAPLCKLMVRTGVQSRNAGMVAHRAAALNAEVSRITAIPPGQLADGTVTRTVDEHPFRYTITTTASTTGGTQTVTITITPTGPQAIGGLSRVITRKGGNPNPFAL